MKYIILIPTRLESVRLPGKALLELGGLPIIVHTAKRAMLSKKASDVFVCTDSQKIIETCHKFNIKTIKTGSKFTNGTERIASISNRFKNEIVIDVQGDEPLIEPGYIDKLINYYEKLKDKPDIIVPHHKILRVDKKSIVKMVFTTDKRVLYFSRNTIPYYNNQKGIHIYKHLSIILFSKGILNKYKNLKKSSLEIAEDIELLRALENGFNIYTFEIKGSSFSIDIKEDFIRAKNLIENDEYRKLYQ